MDPGSADLRNDCRHWPLCRWRPSFDLPKHPERKVAFPKRIRQRCQISCEAPSGQRSQQKIRQPQERYNSSYSGVNDIKNHRYLNTINFANLLAKKISPPFRPEVKGSNDTSNFSNYPENNTQGVEIAAAEDPFLKWDWYHHLLCYQIIYHKLMSSWSTGLLAFLLLHLLHFFLLFHLLPLFDVFFLLFLLLGFLVLQGFSLGGPFLTS